MRTVASMVLLSLAAVAPAAPALGEKPPRWEYAELSYRAIPGRAGGVDADGNQVAAVPASSQIKWITGSAEMESKGWIEMAEKLKATAFKKDGSAAFLKIQFLNFLGSEGWELMEQPGSTTVLQQGMGGRGPGEPPAGIGPSTGTHTWMLKRRVPY